MNCEDLEALLAPYVDDEATPADRERVGEHLRRCPPCAARAAGERAARRLVQLRAPTLSTPAPPALRARCAALARGERRGWGWRAWSLAAATASVGALTVGIGYGILTHSTTLLVAGLTLDHLKCFALSANDPGGADARTVAAGLQRDYGWKVTVPPGDRREGLTLVGARRCLSTDGTVAHVLYRHDGKPLSLFVLPEHTGGASRVSLVGHDARIWSAGRTTYVLLANDGEAGMRPMARYFEAALH